MKTFSRYLGFGIYIANTHWSNARAVKSAFHSTTHLRTTIQLNDKSMRLELEQNPSQVSFADNLTSETTEASRATEAAQFLSDGIKAAQAGNRAVARLSLLRAAELDPQSESAWLWLSSISEYPEELFVFLTNVLEINPENPRALGWATATKSLLAKNFVQRGIDASEANQPDAASQYFSQALEYDEQNPMAWLWLASLSDSDQGKITYLEKVLEFDPENESALAGYKAASNSIRANLLAEARMAAVAGNNTEAHDLLDAILAEEPDAEDAWVLRSHLANGFEDKIHAFTRILEINPDNAGARASLESLTSIMDAVAPKVSEPIVEEFVEETVEPVEESPAPYSFAEESAAPVNFAEESEAPDEALGVFASAVDETETPSWMHSVIEEVPSLSSDAAYDGTIEVNYADETSSEDVAYSPAEFVDTDLESEFESSNESEGYSFAPAEMVEEQETSAEFSSEESSESMESNEPEGETQISAQDEVEEITYELAPEPEGQMAVTSESQETVQETAEVSEPSKENDFIELAGFTASEPIPFSNEVSEFAADEYPTVASIVIDAETLANVRNFDLTNGPAADVYETTEDEISDDSDMPFGMTMIGGRVPVPESNEGFNVPFEMTMFGSHIPMPSADFEVEAPQILTGFETKIVSRFDTPRVVQPTSACSFCKFENDVQAIHCQGCMAVITLADLELLLANNHADKNMLRQAVEGMERDRSSREFGEAELTTLGIGHLNLRNLQYGYNYLFEASQLNPDNVVLGSQVNALLIRLGEIKQQDEAQQSMPKGKTILVVDDSPTVRKLIAGKLEKCGHDVFCSNDGVEAMERLEDLRPDLILLDITMPRMDGYQVCKLIRSNSLTKDVPVVMISGKDGFFDKVRGRMAGTSGYITKPFGPETLMKAVESYLQTDA